MGSTSSGKRDQPGPCGPGGPGPQGPGGPGGHHPGVHRIDSDGQLDDFYKNSGTKFLTQPMSSKKKLNLVLVLKTNTFSHFIG